MRRLRPRRLVIPYGDQDFAAAMVGWFAQASAFSSAAKTYQVFSGHWPDITDPGDPIASKLNTLPKYIGFDDPDVAGLA